MNESFVKNTLILSRIKRIAFVFIIFLVLLGGFTAVLAWTPAGLRLVSLLPQNILVGDISIEQKTKTEIHDELLLSLQEKLNAGWTFKANDQQIVFQPSEILPDPAHPTAVRNLVQYQIDQAIDQALEQGQARAPWQEFFIRLQRRANPLRIQVPVTLARASIAAKLQSESDKLLHLPKNASLHVTWQAEQKTPEISIEAEQSGSAIHLESALNQLEAQAVEGVFSPISLQIETINPEITASQLEALKQDVPALLAHAPFRLTAGDKAWIVTTSTLAGWLNGVSSTRGLILGIDPDRFFQTSIDTAWIKALFHPVVDGEIIGLSHDETRVQEFTTPEEGTTFDTAQTLQNILQAFANGSSTIPLVVHTLTPLMQGLEADRLGVKEIIGVGRSNFVGSPVNRRKNIALGAKKVNGTLVAPGTEFSLIKLLTPIDETGGWLKELVIKDNKTFPEFGGGLCQIGTTAFRGALSSGLPITARTNHAYRVPYYEPAGTDATIYDPAPDFRFKNDTEHWILITSHIEGNDVTFTFWGTRDGRTIQQTSPKIYNIVPPPPEKIIETLDLKPGEKKCTEHAHNGADASFEYTVTPTNGEAKTVTFKSHYKPWGAVCLLGVTQLTASSTSNGIDETGVNNPN